MEATIGCEDGYTLDNEEMNCTKIETIDAISKSTSNIKSEIIGQSSSAKTTLVMTSWKNSAEHNAIMTSTKYTKFATISYTANGKTYTVVLFA